MIPIDIK